MSMRHHLRRFAYAGLLVALVIGASRLWPNDQSADAASQSPVTQRAAALYSIFARAHVASDDVPAGLIRARDADELGLEPSSARRAYADSHRLIFAVPSTRGACLSIRLNDGSSGLNCGAAGQPPVLMSYAGAVGLVPNGVTALRYTMDDGSVLEAAPSGNVWHGPANAASVQFVGTALPPTELTPASSIPAGATLHPNGVVSNGDFGVELGG